MISERGWGQLTGGTQEEHEIWSFYSRWGIRGRNNREVFFSRTSSSGAQSHASAQESQCYCPAPQLMHKVGI